GLYPLSLLVGTRQAAEASKAPRGGAISHSDFRGFLRRPDPAGSRSRDEGRLDAGDVGEGQRERQPFFEQWLSRDELPPDRSGELEPRVAPAAAIQRASAPGWATQASSQSTSGRSSSTEAPRPYVPGCTRTVFQPGKARQRAGSRSRAPTLSAGAPSVTAAATPPRRSLAVRVTRATTPRARRGARSSAASGRVSGSQLGGGDNGAPERRA